MPAGCQQVSHAYWMPTGCQQFHMPTGCLLDTQRATAVSHTYWMPASTYCVPVQMAENNMSCTSSYHSMLHRLHNRHCTTSSTQQVIWNTILHHLVTNSIVPVATPVDRMLHMQNILSSYRGNVFMSWRITLASLGIFVTVSGTYSCSSCH